jgi:hypothetical protein
MFKPLYICILGILATLLGVYVLVNVHSLEDSALSDRVEKKQDERLAKLSLPCSEVSGTVLDVTEKLVTVQGVSPCTISLVYVNGDIPTGLTPGKIVIMRGEFKKGLFVTDNITLTGVSLETIPETSPQPLGLVDRMIFFIAYWLS